MESKSPPPPAPVTPSLSPDPVEAKQEAVITQVHSAIRAAGQQVEKVRKRRDEEPGGIAAKVDSLLKGPGPVRMRQTLRVEQTLKVLRRPTIAFQFVSKIHTGTRGFTFDDSEDGRQSLIEELYRVKTEGVREVERLLQLRRLSAGQGRSDVAKAMAERAVLAARAHVSQRPQDAHAHALLAETLATTGEDGRKEMLQEIGTALRLEADHPRALLVRLEDQVARLREYLLREGPRGLHMPPRDPQEVMRRLYAQPPTEAALQAHEAASAEIRSLIVRIMDRASGKPEWMLRACAALMLPPLDVEFAELARSGKARSFEHFSQSAAEIENSGAWTRMEKVGWITQLQRVLDSVGEDGQMIAVISAVPALWGSGQPGRSSSDRLFWTAVPEKLREFFDRGMSRAAAIGRKDDSITAAKACEAVACLEFAAASFGAKVRHEGLALRAISLDPWRVHALDLLTATLAPGFPNAAQALTEIRLAVLDGYSSHQRCAAAADHAGDWASAERHLQACVKLRPTSLEALSYLIAIRLCEDQTPERFAEVQQRFDSARSVYSEQQDSISPQVAEAFIMNYIVFLCLQEDWKSATDVFAISAAGGRLSEAAAKEAALLIQSR
ncbi:MAG TPA: hypothetical protein VD994_14770 [Prosthecobacter sp.]|nr:hypothetical protein [Prosthecobacter sp.]